MKNSKRIEIEKLAYTLTNFTLMKFQPQEDFQQPLESNTTSFTSKIKNFFSPPSKSKMKSPIKRLNSINSETRLVHVKKDKKAGTLKYVKRLSAEHILVGNQDQLDAMSISGVINDFVDTEFLWSINVKKAILHVAVDLKKNYIYLLPDKQLIVYEYDLKNTKSKPTYLSSLKLLNQVKFVQVIRESTFAICYNNGIHIFSIEQNHKIRPILQKQFELGNLNLKIFQIPQPFQNILNIFFQEVQQKSNIFSIWNIQIQFLTKEVKIGKPWKIYELSQTFRKLVKLQNYTKQIFFINLGQKVIAMRKGYVLDSANVNMSSTINSLKYINQQKVLHISDKKIEVYSFSVNMNVSPPKMSFSSTDSIQIPNLSSEYEFLDAVQIFNDNFAIFYQIKQIQNKMLKGQVKYGFYLTQSMNMEDKIQRLLPDLTKNEKIQLAHVQEKADMAHKMGLQRKEIYLRLWNNSNKIKPEDYQYLLDTLDYDTIKLEIQKKLKKSSMSFREVLLIQSGCLSMLSQRVFGINTTKQQIKNYFISHLFIRKLELYKQISLVVTKDLKQEIKGEGQKLMINIQNYNYYKTVDIKTMLIELINRYVNEDKDQIMKIRKILFYFKFSLRIVYLEVIQQIIKSTKKKFIKILEAIPEILPYEHAFEDEPPLQDRALYQGIWGPITTEEWQKHLYIDTVSTIDNKQVLQEVCSNVWYKRYWLTQHQFINLTKKQIQNLYQINKSEVIFYRTIQTIFEVVREESHLRQIMQFLQNVYEEMPQHIFGKIFLYRKLYEHFNQIEVKLKINNKMEKFEDFLKLKDDEIFRQMFNYQKVRKGFILKDMKPLYTQLASSLIFNEGLLSYFASDKSQISDIKYLLNRMNNEKQEFHQQNEGIYEVLVHGMQLKLTLGSEKDIPIDEVLIYIENIPLSDTNPIMKDLQIMHLINEESQRFKKIKLNMSIYEMTKNIDSVIAALVHYQIKQTNILSLRNFDEIKNHTYRIIADIQSVKQKIFSREEQTDLTLFTYLTKLLEVKEMIPFVILLLKDQFINKYYFFNQIMVQNLVLYMYKWKLNSNPAYIESQDYLRDLVTLLGHRNSCREYIQAELDIAKMLSTPSNYVWYPLSGHSDYFTSIQLENIINSIDGNHLLGIDIQTLHQYALKIQQIGSDGALSEITLHGIYEIVILRLIDCDMLKQVIGKIRNLIQIQGDTHYNFIYPSLLIGKIAPQLMEENKELLLRSMAYLFNKPLELLNILEELMNVRGTSWQHKDLLLQKLKQAQQLNLTYSQKNQLFEPMYLKLITNRQEKQSFMNIIRQTLKNLLSHKQQFSRFPEYWIIYTMLCNDPFVLVKYIYNCKYEINIKDFRCFLSYIIREDIFDKKKILQFGKRLFYIIHRSIRESKDIQTIIDQFRNQPLDVQRQIGKVPIDKAKNEFEKKILLSLQRLKTKIKSFNQMDKKKKKQTEEQKKKRIKEKIQGSLTQQAKRLYPFADSDDDPNKKEHKLKKLQTLKIQIQNFDAKFQRAVLLNRNNKNLGNYVSNEKQLQQKSLYYTQKLARDGVFNSLSISKPLQNVIMVGFQNLYQASIKGEAPKPERKKLRITKAATQYIDLNQLNLDEKKSKIIETINEEEHYDELKQPQKAITNQPFLNNKQFQLQLLTEMLQFEINDENINSISIETLHPFLEKSLFVELLKQIISLAYELKTQKFLKILYLIKYFSMIYKSLELNKQYIQVYIRAEKMQAKLDLNLPLQSILRLEGLYIISQSMRSLFEYLLPFIKNQINQNNILKLSKLITLAFKQAELEQEIFYQYLLLLIENYQKDIYNPQISKMEIGMQKEKIVVSLNKIPAKILVSREKQFTKYFEDEAIGLELAKMVVASLRKRRETQFANFLNSMWVVNKKK